MLSVLTSNRHLAFRQIFWLWQRNIALPSSTPLPLPVPPPLSELSSDEDMTSAQVWANQFKDAALPRGYVELTFARSSGPGGQNVNKVNTKAVARCPVQSPWIPKWAQRHLRESPAYVASSDSILISSDAHRTQQQNIQTCLSKVHSLIYNAALTSFRRPTSAETKSRVDNLIKADKVRRRKEKEHRKSVKSSRRNDNWD